MQIEITRGLTSGHIPILHVMSIRQSVVPVFPNRCGFDHCYTQKENLIYSFNHQFPRHNHNKSSYTTGNVWRIYRRNVATTRK